MHNMQYALKNSKNKLFYIFDDFNIIKFNLKFRKYELKMI